MIYLTTQRITKEFPIRNSQPSTQLNSQPPTPFCALPIPNCSFFTKFVIRKHPMCMHYIFHTFFRTCYWLIAIFLAFAGCDFNRKADPSAPLPEHPANVMGIRHPCAMTPVSAFDAFEIKIPSGFELLGKGIDSGAGFVEDELKMQQTDGSVHLKITCGHRKKNGLAVMADLTSMQNAFQHLIAEHRGAVAILRDSVLHAGHTFHTLEARLNWEGYRRHCFWAGTIINGKLFLLDMKYPVRDEAKGKALAMEMVLSFKPTKSKKTVK